VVSPNYKGTVEITKNEHDEVLILANNQEFIADLMFMNQFAVCNCGEIRKWEYFFPNLKAGEAI
jgi:hypothetical protein